MTQEEKQQAIELIRQSVKIAHEDHGAFDEREMDLIERFLRNPSTELIDKLIAHRDQTVGLWATDLPGAVKDPKKVMFEIKF